MTVSQEQFQALRDQVTTNSTLLQQIHREVVGNGSANSSLRERVAANEEAIASLKSWKTRALQTAVQALVAVIGGTLGVHLPHQS